MGERGDGCLLRHVLLAKILKVSKLSTQTTGFQTPKSKLCDKFDKETSYEST